jgi:hypothetical protein
MLLSMLALSIAASISAEAKERKPDPFRVPADSLTGRLRVLAVAPTARPREVEEIPLEFTHAITESLVAAGFEVVPLDTVIATWAQAVRDVGGVYDARTGRRDSLRVERVRALAAAALRERHHAVAWVRPAVVGAHAEFESGEAEWDGVTRHIGGDGVLNVLLDNVPEGRLSALSFQVGIEDPEGRLLYEARTGLQVLSRMGKKGLESAPPEFGLGDPEQRRFALDRSLRPWLERVRPAR